MNVEHSKKIINTDFACSIGERGGELLTNNVIIEEDDSLGRVFQEKSRHTIFFIYAVGTIDVQF